MRLLGIALMVMSFTQAEPPCPEGKIHTWGVLCLTPAELEALNNPPPVPAPVVWQDPVERWREMVAYYWPDWAVDRMLRIMRCESGGIPWVPNSEGSGALGLFQIMEFWQKTWPGDYTDPWTNAAVAYQIWLDQGWGAWSCARRN